MRNLFAAVALIALWIPGSASAVPGAWLALEDGNTIALTVVEDEDGIAFVENWNWSNGDITITNLNLMFDPDPLITFSGAVTDFGAASNFGFIFSQNIVPTAAPGQVRSSLSGSTTDPGGAPSVTITPIAPPLGLVDGDAIPEIMVFSLSQDGGTNFVNAGIDLGPQATLPGTSNTYGPFGEGFVAGPSVAGSYDFMRVDINFGLGGGGEIFTFNGLAEVIVPEPAAFGLLGLGLVALVLRRR